MQHSTLNYKSIQFESIHTWDAPDFVDAFISYAEYTDGTVLSEQDLDDLNADSCLVSEALHNHLY